VESCVARHVRVTDHLALVINVKGDVSARLSRLAAEIAEPDPYHVSLIQVGLGEVEQALDSLENAYRERSLFLTCDGQF
jgi:hypothetical protein